MTYRLHPTQCVLVSLVRVRQMDPNLHLAAKARKTRRVYQFRAPA
jgi:hypothetical protein